MAYVSFVATEDIHTYIPEWKQVQSLFRCLYCRDRPGTESITAVPTCHNEEPNKTVWCCANSQRKSFWPLPRAWQESVDTWTSIIVSLRTPECSIVPTRTPGVHLCLYGDTWSPCSPLWGHLESIIVFTWTPPSMWILGSALFSLYGHLTGFMWTPVFMWTPSSILLSLFRHLEHIFVSTRTPGSPLLSPIPCQLTKARKRGCV